MLEMGSVEVRVENATVEFLVLTAIVYPGVIKDQ